MESPVAVMGKWAALCFFSSLCLLCATWFFNRKPSSKYKSPYHWPLVGVLPSLMWNSSRLHEWCTECFVSLGDEVSSFLCEGPIFSKLKYLATCHPENMEYILKTNFSNFPKGSDFNEIFEFLGRGIFNDDGESWSTQRRMIHTCFRSDEFRRVFGRNIRDVVESQLVPFLAHVALKNSVFDFQDILMRFAFDVNVKVLFGKEGRYLSADLPINEFAEALDVANSVTLYRHVMPMFFWKLLRFLNVGKERSFSKARKTVDSLVCGYISSNRENLEKGGADKVGLLSMLVKSSADSLDENYLRDIAVNLFFAGKDTIASGLVWFFWMVAKAPHVERKILEELKSVVASKKTAQNDDSVACNWPWVFNVEELKGLVYLHAALCESLRLNPPLPLNSKSVVKPDILPDGTVVKPGMQILISYYSEGRMPWIWGQDSLEFRPERWIDNEGMLRRELSSKFFAFSAGPRSCVGKNISFIEMKLCVAAVLYNFHVKLVPGYEVCSKPSISLHMKNELLVHIQRRGM